MQPIGAYVYEHWRPDTGTCFYVGKGRGKRAWLRRSRNRLHDNIVAKLSRLNLKIEVRIVASNLSDAEALELEVDRIAHWNTIGIKQLANLNEGGIGPIRVSEETRQLMSRAAKSREINSFSGRTHSEETKARWSAIRKGRRLSAEHRAKISAGLRINNGFKGKKHTAETRTKISEFNKTRDLAAFKYYWKGKRLSAETKAKIGAAHKGRVLSAETRAKISASKRRVIYEAP